MRARKRTETKGKVQPCTATRANTKAGRGTPARNAKCAQSRSSPVSDSYERSLQAHDAVTTQQSAEVVQTFLFSAVSTVLWMRDMLPDEYFRTAFYASINKHCSYHEFTHGNDVEVIAQGDRSRPKGYHLRVLKRNVSTRGNQLIEWLETGAFEAIKRGYLDQLQICIFADEGKPTEVLELYCFYFRYSELSTDGDVAVNLEFEDMQTKKKITLKDAREALNTVIRNMVLLNGTMPHLPERCFMSPYLVWNQRRPSGYQPPGFHSSSDLSISFPVTDGWTMGTSTCGELEAAFQTVELGIAYTKGIVIDDDCEAVVMPSFAYGEAFSRLSAVIAHEAGTVQHRKETGEDDALDLLIPRPSSVVRDNENPSAHNKQTRNVNKRPLKYGKDNSKGDTVGLAANTQDKEDLARLKVLQTTESYQTHDTQPAARISQRLIQGTLGRKRKDHGSPACDGQPKTPRLSRPYPNLAFDSNDPYTPAREKVTGQATK